MLVSGSSGGNHREGGTQIYRGTVHHFRRANARPGRSLDLPFKFAYSLNTFDSLRYTTVQNLYFPRMFYLDHLLLFYILYFIFCGPFFVMVWYAPPPPKLVFVSVIPIWMFHGMPYFIHIFVAVLQIRDAYTGSRNQGSKKHKKYRIRNTVL